MRARVLVVEDEMLVALALQQKLEELGYDVCGAASSQAGAVEAALVHRPDLILMDVNLGRGGDGAAAAAEILERMDVPIVCVSAYTGSSAATRSPDSEFAARLVKPFSDAELDATLAEVLTRRPATSATRSEPIRTPTAR